MNIESFLEKDIIEFLEKKDLERKEKREIVAEEIEEFSLKKDYYKLFKTALEKRDLYTAKKLFEEVQQNFANAETDVEKETYTGLMENMFTEMKGFDAKEETEKEFVKEITSMGTIKEIESKEIKKDEFEEKKIKIKNELAVASEEISEFLQKGDLAAAMNEYKSMKGRFNEFPDEAKVEKEELFNDLISSYYQIKKLEKIKKEEKEETKKEKDEKKKQLLSRTKEDVLLVTKKIEIFLKQGKLTKAMEEYENLKEIFDNFPKKFEEEKKALYKHTIKVYKAIKKRTEEIKRKKTKKSMKKEITPEEREKNKSLNFIINLKKEVKDTIMLIKERKLEEAEVKLLEVKRMMNWFPEDKQSEKEQFEHLIDEITHRINFLKQTPNIQNA